MTAGTGTFLGPNTSALIVSTMNTLTVGFLVPAFKENVSGYSNQGPNNSLFAGKEIGYKICVNFSIRGQMGSYKISE